MWTNVPFPQKVDIHIRRTKNKGTIVFFFILPKNIKDIEPKSLWDVPSECRNKYTTTSRLVQFIQLGFIFSCIHVTTIPSYTHLTEFSKYLAELNGTNSSKELKCYMYILERIISS